MPKTDTLDALDDEMKHTLNILWIYSENTLNLLCAFSEPSLNLLWTYSEYTLKILWTYSAPVLWTFSEPTLNLLWTYSEDMPKIWLSNMDPRDAKKKTILASPYTTGQREKKYHKPSWQAHWGSILWQTFVKIWVFRPKSDHRLTLSRTHQLTHLLMLLRLHWRDLALASDDC